MITSLDLFSGAGGFSLGFSMAGIETIGAIEIDRFACETYEYNFPHIPLIQADIRNISDTEIKNQFSGVDIIAGGAPCQGFSVAGPSQYGKIDSSRNSLILQVARYAQILKPKIVVLENVKGILSGKLTKSRKAIKEYITALESLGYEQKTFILQSADFGVPQWRERVFIIAAQNKSNLPTYFAPYFKHSQWRTVSDALSDLPEIHAGEGTEERVDYEKEAETDYQKWLRQQSEGVYNHVAMQHTKRLLERFKHIPIGGSLVDVPAEHGQRERNGTTLDARKRFKMNNQRLHPEKVSTAVTASFQSNFVHPFLDRNITAREGARLQSFPDRFRFLGPRTLMSKKLLIRENRQDEIGLSQYNQIGNSVPPLLAKAIGDNIRQCLN